MNQDEEFESKMSGEWERQKREFGEEKANLAVDAALVFHTINSLAYKMGKEMYEETFSAMVSLAKANGLKPEQTKSFDKLLKEEKEKFSKVDEIEERDERKGLKIYKVMREIEKRKTDPNAATTVLYASALIAHIRAIRDVERQRELLQPLQVLCVEAGVEDGDLANLLRAAEEDMREGKRERGTLQ